MHMLGTFQAAVPSPLGCLIRLLPEQPKPKLASTPATKKSILSRDDETDAADTVVYERPVLRTPSPTPSEVAFLDRNGLFDKKRMKSWSFWFRKEWICMSL